MICNLIAYKKDLSQNGIEVNFFSIICFHPSFQILWANKAFGTSAICPYDLLGVTSSAVSNWNYCIVDEKPCTY